MIYEKPYALVAEDGEVLASGEAKELLEEIRKKTISDYKEEKFDLQTKLDCFEGFLDPNERVFVDQGEGKIPRLLASTNRMEIYPQGKVDLNRDEILFRLKRIAHLEEETVYLLTLVKETMDINPYYVPKLSRYLDQGSYLQHYRVRLPLEEFSADFLAKKEWEGKMTKEDWKEAGELLLRDFDMGGNGFKDPLPEPSEEEKKEALAWLDSMGKAEGGTKR